MYGKLMCKEIWDLFEIFSEREAGPANLVDLLNKAVPPVIKKLGLHSFSIKVDVPKDPVHERNRFELTPYDDGIEGKIHLSKTFSTKMNGSVKLFAAADTEEAGEDFERFAKLLFTVCGRVITLDTLDNAYMTDMLTGASNIIGFHKKAGKFCQQGIIEDYAVFYTNIKNFKYVNQKIGMQNGDEILRSYVRRFRENFDPAENGIFRLGADKFVLLITKDRLPDLIHMLKSFEMILSSGINMHVYFQAGIFLAYSGCTTSDLMNYATAAYTAAESGKNGDFVFFEESMLEEEFRIKSVMVAFPDALKKREFTVYYQPKIRTADAKLVGAEALCRWIREDGTIVPPLDFIPSIEKLGSIIQLDMYVLDMVCADMQRWLGSGKEPPSISVNISRRDLAVPDLADKICRIADSHSIPHGLIEIELTETYSSEEFSMLMKLITSLKALGFRISIDDFGSGYSTLTMLKSINADIIKLDRAFIKDMTDKSVTDKTILRNVINMVRELNIEIIAEGVESREQADFLSSAGCGVIQGYLYDRPLPREEFEKRLSDPEYYKGRN